MPAKFIIIRLWTVRILLIIWILVLSKFILFKHQWYVIRNYFNNEFPAYSFAQGWEKANLIPFRSILNMIQNPADYQFWIGNITGNIAGFIPVGFLLPLSRLQRTNSTRVFLNCLSLSVFFEWLQGFLGTGIMDIDDLLLNTLGGMTGFGLFRLICLIRSSPGSENQ